MTTEQNKSQQGYDPDEHCEYCGSEDLLQYSKDGNVLLCDTCRARYDEATAPQIEVERSELFTGYGSLRPFKWTYRTVGPDGTVFTNDSIVTLRQLLKRRYPGITIVEPWKTPKEEIAVALQTPSEEEYERQELNSAELATPTIPADTLSNARSYFSSGFEESCRSAEFVREQIEIHQRTGNPEVAPQIELLGLFGATLNAAEKKLGKRLGLAQRDAIEYLFDHEGVGWGKLERHVYNKHRRAGSRNRRAINKLEQAGVIDVDYHGNVVGAPVTVSLAVRATELEPLKQAAGYDEPAAEHESETPYTDALLERLDADEARLEALKAPQYERPEWVAGIQTVRCGKHGIRRQQDSRHAAWIRREARKHGLKARVSLVDGAAIVQLFELEPAGPSQEEIAEGVRLFQAELDATAPAIARVLDGELAIETDNGPVHFRRVGEPVVEQPELFAVFATDGEHNVYRVSDPLRWDEAQDEWSRLDDLRRAGRIPQTKFFEVRKVWLENDRPIVGPDVRSHDRYDKAPLKQSMTQLVATEHPKGFGWEGDAARAAWKLHFPTYKPRRGKFWNQGVQGYGGWYYWPNGTTAAQGLAHLAQICRRRFYIVQGTDGRWYPAATSEAK